MSRKFAELHMGQALAEPSASIISASSIIIIIGFFFDLLHQPRFFSFFFLSFLLHPISLSRFPHASHIFHLFAESLPAVRLVLKPLLHWRRAT